MATTSSPMTENRSLTFFNKFAYGFGDLAGTIYATLYGFFMSAFLIDTVGLRPGAVGAILGLSVIIDAFTDPIVGSLSDQTRSRWGGKRPWLLFGALPMGLAFFLHWLVPPLPEWGLIAYYAVIANLLRLTYTIIGVPYTALTAIMTHDYDERTQLNTYRFTFSVWGGVLAVILQDVFVGLSDNTFVGHALAGGIWGVLIVVSTLFCFFGTFELPQRRTAPPQQYSFLQRIQIALRNRPYMMVTGIYLLSWLTLQFVQVNLLLYTRYWLDAEEHFTTLIVALQVINGISLIFWAWLTSKIGKRWVYIIGMVMWMIASLCLYFVQPGQITQVVILSSVIGFGLSVAYLIPWSMLPDTIEYNELQTGERQEGVFYGMFVFLQKLGLSLGLFISNYILDIAGYINPPVIDGVTQSVVQPDAVLFTLRVFVSLVPLVLLGLSLPLTWAYPITRERFMEIQAQLAERKAKTDW